MNSLNVSGVIKRVASALLKAKILLLISILLSSYASGKRPAESATVHGTITDASTGEYVYGANIFLRGTTLGTVSNIEGFYSMPNLPTGDFTLIVTFIGYSKHEENFELRKGTSIRMDVSLSPVDLEGEGIIVTDELSKFEHNINISTISISPRQIKSLPQMGEVDLFRQGAAISTRCGGTKRLFIRIDCQGGKHGSEFNFVRWNNGV